MDEQRRDEEDPEARFARLLGVIRHELMSPLTIVLGFADFLPGADQPDTPAAAIRRNAKLAVLLVQRLRDADAIVSGDPLDLQRTEVDVAALVAATVADVRETLLARHIVELRSSGAPVPASIDADRIRQVLFNLLSNAAKYSDPDSTVIIDVRADAAQVTIAITDEGEGIAPADVERAFEAFTRLSTQMPGTGLGLAVARALARAHGGDVMVEPSPEGPGTRFVLAFPRWAG